MYPNISAEGWILICGGLVALIVFLVSLHMRTPVKKREADELVTTENPKEVMLFGVYDHRIKASSSMEELEALRSEINSKVDSFSGSDATNLLGSIRCRVVSIAAEEEQKARRKELEPEFKAFRALRDVTDKNVLLTELHRLLVPNEDGRVIGNEFLRYFEGWEDEDEGLVEIYPGLLAEELYRLVRLAEDVDTERAAHAYEQARTLRREYAEHYNEEPVDDEIAERWNRMVVRFNPEPEWEDLVRSEAFWGGRYFEVMQYVVKRAQDRDLLFMQYAWLLLEDQDKSFREAVVEDFSTMLNNEIELAYEKLGFTFEEERD